LKDKANLKQIKYLWLLDQPEQAFDWRPEWFVETLASIVNQTVPLWQLTICVSAPYVSSVRQALSAYWKTNTQPRQQISVVTRKSTHPEKILRTLMRKSQLDWVAVVNEYDKLALDATYLVLKEALRGPSPNIIYGDHDYLSSKRQVGIAFNKPAFCEDLLCSQNYIGHFFAIRREALLRHGSPTDGLELAWAHDLLLRMSEPAASAVIPAVSIPIVHTHGVLYHCRQRKPSAPLRQTLLDQSTQAVRNHFIRKRLEVKTTPYQRSLIRNAWPVPQAQPKVSLIIPTRDGYKILKACVDSITELTKYRNFEILIIDNQSSDPKTLRYLAHIVKRDQRVSVLPFDKPFNYSAINNFAVQQCSGEIIGFINNDVEVLNAGWLTEMVSHALRPEVGAVGALLYYPDMTVQHGGVIVGMHGVADHALKGADPRSVKDDPFGMLRSVRSTDAVTAAVMLVRKENFNAVRGFDEKHLKIAFNDVDLCLKLRQQDLKIIYTPHAKLIHHESKSRRLDQSIQSQQTERYEHAIMKARWGTDRIQPQQHTSRYI
jgi:O-antigen biosynthesis protein